VSVERPKRLAALGTRGHLFVRLELLIQLLQLRDDVIDDRGTNRQLAQCCPHAILDTLDILSDSCPARRGRPVVCETLRAPIDLGLEPPDASERPQDRTDFDVLDLTS
jgi:hypothetical protein